MLKIISSKLLGPVALTMGRRRVFRVCMGDHMRKNFSLALASVISMAGFGTASAADLPVKAPPMPPPVIYNWTGCYIGGNIGAGWDDTNQSRIATVAGTVVNPPQGFGTGNGYNVVGGGQIGCDYQFATNWVVGVQGMFDFGNIDESHVNISFPTFFDTSRVKDLFTVTGRLGYLLAPNLLGYAKAGGAWTRVDYSNFFTVPAVGLSETALGVDRQGWTAGFGVEWMFAPGWSVFGEFNYMDFGTRNIAFVAAPGTVNAASVLATKLTVDQAVLGVNYKFNWAQPLVAKF
jgi:outer membrane immunogenic protein